MNLHWWSNNNFDGKENFGDYLSVVIVEKMKKNYNVIEHNITKHRTKHLYAIGSILTMGAQNATVWGSGLIEPPRKSIRILWRLSRKLDIRCVRGPKTREQLLSMGYDCPESYGDPALILPEIYKVKTSKKTKNKVVVIKHFADNMENYKKNDGFVYLDPMVFKEYWNEIIDDIASAKLVISSSLHGIIVAEAYGVPAILLKGSQTSNSFKYDDYYLSTGRNNYPVANEIDDAIELAACYEKPDLTKLKQNIFNTFPKDIWEN